MKKYSDIATYSMEQNPEEVMFDTIKLIESGVDTKTIHACLTRREWIEKGFQMLRRISMRETEKREFDLYMAAQ